MCILLVNNPQVLRIWRWYDWVMLSQYQISQQKLSIKT